MEEIPMTQGADLARGWDPGDDETAEDPYELWRHFRSSQTPLYCEQYGGYHVVSRYADAREVMLDYGRFISSEKVAVPPHNMPNLPPLEYDPPEHRDLRSPLNSWFSPRSVERMEPGIRDIVADLLKPLEGRREFDFVTDFAIPVPREITWQLIHLPVGDKGRVRGWFHALERLRTRDPEAAGTAYRELLEYLARDLERRRNSPRDEEDVIGRLLDTRIGGEPLPDEQLVMFYFQILVAGLGTTTSALAMMLWYLARHPEVSERLRAEPWLLPSATEELLRVYSPIPFIGRTVARDTEFKGCPMKAGERVAVLFGSANADETEFPEADRVRLDRQPNRHLAFGTGVHRCLGSNLARAMIRISLAEILSRLGDLRLAETEPVVWEMNGDIRTISSLPLVQLPPS
jgi:cytochrome P450